MQTIKTKFIFSNNSKELEFWNDMPIVPRVGEWINLTNLLSANELNELKESAACWSGEHGKIDAIEHKFENGSYFSEIYVWCED